MYTDLQATRFRAKMPEETGAASIVSKERERE
jgi:hypothetical protein